MSKHRFLAAVATAAVALVASCGSAHAAGAAPTHKFAASFVTPAERSGKYDSLRVRQYSASGKSSVVYSCSFPTETIAYTGVDGAPVTTWTSKGRCHASSGAAAGWAASYTYSAAHGITLTLRTGTTHYVCHGATETDTHGADGAFTLALAGTC